MRKLCCLFLGILFLLPVYALGEENLLKNGDFELTDAGFPEDWYEDAYYTSTAVSTFSLEKDGYSGNCIRVTNISENDARFTQTVSVQPDTIYKITCMCRAENIPEGLIGATISIKDTFSYSESLTDTDGEWAPLTLYGRTGADQTNLVVCARVGGYGYTNTGSACFDNFEMIAVDDVPEGATLTDFTPTSSKSSKTETLTATEEEPARNTEAYVLLTALYALLLIAVTRKYRRNPEKSGRFYCKCLVVTLIAAFALRVVLACRVRGYYTDVNCFSSWADTMFSVGPRAFYSGAVWCDYPPGYMLLLWPVGAIRALLRALGASSDGLMLLTIKFPAIAFDLFACAILYSRSEKKLGARAALLMAAFYAFNPAIFTDSAAWGQIDSIFTLLIVLCALDADDNCFARALIEFALAALIKPQSLLFAPLGLFAVVVRLIQICKRNRSAFGKSLKSALIGLLAAVLGVYLLAMIIRFDAEAGLLQNLTEPLGWLKELYAGTMQGYSYLTVNALNLYALLDLNWQQTGAHPFITFVAWALFALAYVVCGLIYLFSKKRKSLPLVGGVLIVLICTFAPMIHERYMFPAVLLLAFAYAEMRDRRILASLFAASCTLFLNEFLVLQGGMTSANYGHLQSSEAWINVIVSLLNIANAFFLVWTAADICVFGHVHSLSKALAEKESAGLRALKATSDHKLHLKRIDVLLIAIVTAVYSAVAFANLGTTKAPQTSWTSEAADDSVTFDLGSQKRFRMMYYGGICNTNFTVSLSNDGVEWTTPYYANYDQGEIFRWLRYTPLDEDGKTVLQTTEVRDDGGAYTAFSGYEGETIPFQTARYIRISAVAPGLILSEVAFQDENGDVYPIAEVIAEHDGEKLADEQDTVPAYPSYYNSTYFDEIYHARTAYEHLHGLSTYEWTHPPLGKVLMMVGIQLFGMTPFGWRFMGALTGVLMLPLMYLLAKQLTKSTKLSFIAMFLLSVDSMHFTQTRIATIDSYAVFWIMLMYFFMFRYFQMRWKSSRDFLKSLIVLGLCGITMGVAWATKWIGLYASAGLAVLFFWSMIRRLREYMTAKREENPEWAYTKAYPKYIAFTILFCLIFFVALPVMIYYFSYYWHLRGEGLTCFADMFSKRYIRKVIDLQQRIFNYHAGLSGDTHYFRSPWYQWPIIYWPMWYYSGTSDLPVSGMISSISCMGNPAVWWFGLVALLYVLFRAAWKKRASSSDAMVLIGFASQFLPWVLVPRSTFIYHYFASVPFIILASILLLNRLRERDLLAKDSRETAFTFTTIALLGAALFLFIMFYPLESGTPVVRWYAQLLRWFKWYNF